MEVDNVLRVKGRHVETIPAEAGCEVAAQRLRVARIGALVVVGAGERIEGIVSERDIVIGLARHGDRLLRLPVRAVMTRRVITCSPHDTLKLVMKLMTDNRIRHLPVIDAGRLAGLISIGDVVKNRLDELELETNVIRDAYIARR
jgi:CBS domain-containing protein